jgi:hypothetical protein
LPWSTFDACGGRSTAPAFTVPVDAVATALAEIDRAMQSADFRAATPPTAAGAARIYRRGSALGDVLIGGSGLSTLTTRLGPLSAKGVVVVWVGEHRPGTMRLIVSLVDGSHVGGDFVDAVDDAVRGLIARGVPVSDDAWSRAVDVDPTLPTHPRRAAELGLR